MSDDFDKNRVVGAADTLALLEQQAVGMRLELVRLRELLADTQRTISEREAVRLLEVNEQLVLAAIHAEAIAETALRNLAELTDTRQPTLPAEAANREQLRALEVAIRTADRLGKRVAVLFFEPGQFDQLGERFGHASGSELLHLDVHSLSPVAAGSANGLSPPGNGFLIQLGPVSEILPPESAGERNIEVRSHEMPRRLVTRHESALAEQEVRLRDLRQANENLVTAALAAQALEADAQAARARQIKFLAMVAHELRNPLAPIRTAAELLSRSDADQQKLAELQGIIARQVAHMSRLVDDLLDVSRASAGKFQLERSTVAIASILRAAVETCRPLIDRKCQRLHTQLPADGMTINGDPVRLAQVFCNLLENASKYTSEGGELVLTTLDSGRGLAIKISDNGIGISPEALPHIFDLFVQDRRALEFRHGGLGIGLAVVRDLVEAHGGTVVASSAGPDLGSEFVVTLPGLDALAHST